MRYNEEDANLILIIGVLIGVAVQMTILNHIMWFRSMGLI